MTEPHRAEAGPGHAEDDNPTPAPPDVGGSVGAGAICGLVLVIIGAVTTFGQGGVQLFVLGAMVAGAIALVALRRTRRFGQGLLFVLPLWVVVDLLVGVYLFRNGFVF